MSISHCIKAYKGEVWLNGCNYQSYYEFNEAKQDTEREIKDLKNKIRQICLCTPKDVFPTDEDGDTYWKINQQLDDLFEELNELEWKMAKINMIQTILDDWEYTGNVDPKKNWTDINPDLYADLKEEFKNTLKMFDGKPESIESQKEETDKMDKK